MRTIKLFGREYVITDMALLLLCTINAFSAGVLLVISAATHFYLFGAVSVYVMWSNFKNPRNVVWRDDVNVTGYCYILTVCLSATLYGLYRIVGWLT